MTWRNVHAARIWVLAFCLLPFALTREAHAQPAPPVLDAPVNDFAQVFDAASAQELERRIRALQKATGDVVVVATVTTFKPYGDIKQYAVKMLENGGRGIGEKGKDNGVLFVLAVEDRRVDIEVGYGLEEFITDGFAGETIRQYMTPEFRNGSYGAGLLAGATRIINRIAERRGVTLEDVPREAPVPVTGTSNFPWGGLVIIIILIAISWGRRRRGGFWGGGGWSGWSSGIGPFGGGGRFGGGFGGFGGGGGGGGGFGGFGGGRSGGGGASGGW